MLLITLVALGAFFLYRSLPGSGSASVVPIAPGSADDATVQSTVDMKVLYIKVVGDDTHVQVRVPGGEVVTDTVMRQGQYASYSQPTLDVTIADPGAVEVYINGEERDMSDKDPGYSFKVDTETVG
ncbi:RodZ domain-containing protein [Murinocardiopsis flavida]|uniref:RodZ domain-containing protein n=1 Tax=Murinocardiopsis flavida TaxID=645275 RepID=UPI0031837BA1